MFIFASKIKKGATGISVKVRFAPMEKTLKKQ